MFEVRQRPKHSGAQPHSARPPRQAHTSPASEWIGLGLNCGGAVLAWIGVVGTAALMPVTGATSGAATILLWGGALASSGQCLASTYRVTNNYRGRADINDRLDNSPLYVNSMLGADVIGLLGAGGAIKEIRATSAALHVAGIEWRTASGALSRPLRRRLTTVFELQGSRRVSAVVINRFVRQKLLDAVGGVIGLVGSSTSGFTKEVAVWITEENAYAPPR